jgi:hypothetical protein
VVGLLSGALAAQYRRAIAAKTREAMIRKAQLGHVTGGRVFGYSIEAVNGHKERRIVKAEAAVIRRIFTQYAGGFGLATIAHMLNGEHAVCPQPQRGRAPGCAPSSIREILIRPLYRGEIVHGQTKKRDKSGKPKPSPRPASEWTASPRPRCGS